MCDNIPREHTASLSKEPYSARGENPRERIIFKGSQLKAGEERGMSDCCLPARLPLSEPWMKDGSKKVDGERPTIAGAERSGLRSGLCPRSRERGHSKDWNWRIIWKEAFHNQFFFQRFARAGRRGRPIAPFPMRLKRSKSFSREPRHTEFK